MKSIQCQVCDTEFIPNAKNRYTANESTSMGTILNGTKSFDCFDCPKCGCQIIAGERMRTAEGESGEEVDKP